LPWAQQRNRYFLLENQTYLLVEHHIGGLKLLVDVLAEVVGELDVRDRLGRIGFRLSEFCSWGSRYSVQRHGLVLVVADLLKVHMRDLLGVEVCVERIVSRHVTGQFGEVRGHVNLLISAIESIIARATQIFITTNLF